jgi:hypothetical protein
VRHLSVRFQHWIVGFTVTMGVVLTIGLMLAVFGKFSAMAESDARGRLGGMADAAAIQLDNILSDQGHILKVLLNGGVEQFVRDGGKGPLPMAPMLLSTLDASPELYAIYYGLSDGQFLQAVAVSTDNAVLARLGAPPEAKRGVHRVVRREDGVRRESWDFLTADLQTSLSRVEFDAQYNPTERPWYRDAMSHPRV